MTKLTGTGKGGRVTKEDVEAFIKGGNKPAAAPVAAAPVAAVAPLVGRTEKRVPMTRLRKRIAERLLEAKNT
uniref:E3 binding domain-containing protein n=1 Tax=Streptomyces scabiei TaxID=1930 RepID=UPI0038F8166B